MINKIMLKHWAALYTLMAVGMFVTATSNNEIVRTVAFMAGFAGYILGLFSFSIGIGLFESDSLDKGK